MKGRGALRAVGECFSSGTRSASGWGSPTSPSATDPPSSAGTSTTCTCAATVRTNTPYAASARRTFTRTCVRTLLPLFIGDDALKKERERDRERERAHAMEIEHVGGGESRHSSRDAATVK